MTENNTSNNYTLKPWEIIVLLGVLLSSRMVLANTDIIQFNTAILDIKDKANLDLSKFSQAGYIMPGNYTLTPYINKDELPEQSIEWLVPEDNTQDSKACLPPDLVNEIGLNPEIKSQLTWWDQGQCLDISSVPGMEARGDLGASALYLNIPQAYLEYRAQDWDPPSRWDDGVSGLLLDYYTSAQTRHEDNKGTFNSVSGNGTMGTNIGPWRLRADWQARHENSGNANVDENWNWSRFYAYRALATMQAKLTLGENSLFSDIFDSFRYTGASLQSDDNMLPPNLRGYAPEISGVAQTNAKVVISQQGRVIREIQVAAGPFRIQDINEMISGELDIRVEEQDGSIQNFTVNSATVPYLTRPGTIRYKVAAGRPSNNEHETNGPMFATSEFSWGVTNGWSLYGGGIGGNDYNALSIGFGRDLLAFGALSFDATQSRAQLPHDVDVQRGNSYRLSYSKRFEETGSDMSFAGYRFSEQGFMSMSEFLDARKDNTDHGSSKEMYSIRFSQQLNALQVSAYLDYTHQTYWDRSDKDRITLSLSRQFTVGSLRNLNLSVTGYRNKYESTNDDGMYLSLSIPWGNDGTLSYNGTYNRHDNTHQASYYGRLNDRGNYQISAGASRNGTLSSGYYNHQTDVAQINASASYQEKGYSSIGVAVQGGMTATAKGAALHRSGIMGGTRMLLDTGGVSHIPVKTNGANTMTNYFGKAVVTDMTNYYRNRVSIDLNTLPENAEAITSVVQGTLTEGAIGYRKFDVVAGIKAMAVLRLSNGEFPPFGATVQNIKRQEVGIVNDEGSIYLSGIQANEKMRVLWGGKTQCEITLPPILPTDVLQGLLLPCHATADTPATT